MRIRTPAVAGAFYPVAPEELQYSISKDSRAVAPNDSIIAGIAPHAGYMYSGMVASPLFDIIPRKSTVIVIGPNHFGIGGRLTTLSDCSWETPLGAVTIGAENASYLADKCDLTIDYESHRKEHSIEVLIPMLQYRYSDFELVPILMADQSMDVACDLGMAVANLAETKDAMILASSDLTHYEPDDMARRKDSALLKSILDMDIKGMYDTLKRLHVSACGYGPMAAAITAAGQRGAKKGSLLRYGTSGDVTSDKDSVVGYCSVVFA